MEDDHNHGNSSNVKVAFLLNFGFTILEIIGGIWTNSLAILSDAVHDLGDTFSLGLAWFLDGYSDKKPDLNYSFGYSRFSLLGALVNSLVLLIGSILIIIRAIPRIINPEHSNAQGMLIFAIMGIIMNGLAVLKMRDGKSLNEKVVMWHLLEDVMGWLAILVVSIILMFKEIRVLDPILSIGITIYVLYNVVRNMIEVFKVFLQSVPEGISISDLEAKIVEIDGVDSVHHTHVWSLEGEHNYLSTHAVIPECTVKGRQVEIKEKIKKLLNMNDIDHVTVEIEFADEVNLEEESDI